MLTVGLIYNIKKHDSEQADTYLEWDDPSTIEAIKKALSENCRIIPIEADGNLLFKLRRYKRELDVVFNIAEGMHGSWREAMAPMFLEEIGIPYTGSDPATLVLALNKERTKQILSFFNIKCPSHKVFSDIPELNPDDILPLEFPLIVKPLWEGSSKGIENKSLVMNLQQCQAELARVIQKYNEPAIVEEFIPGREFTVGILGNGENIQVLPIVELNFSSLPEKAAPIYSYEAKWVWDVPEMPLNIFQCPANLSASLKERIEQTAKDTYKALGCQDWCRIDMRLNKREMPYILELNPIPGILPNPEHNSCLPKAARAEGWSYSQLINQVLFITCKRYGIKYEQNCRNFI